MDSSTGSDAQIPYRHRTFPFPLSNVFPFSSSPQIQRGGSRKICQMAATAETTRQLPSSASTYCNGPDTGTSNGKNSKQEIAGINN